jgi:hypothetical protein
VALTQPILNQISAFDATTQKIFYFATIGGDQVVGNRLIIRNNQTGAIVYNQIQYTYKFEHTLPAGTLTNNIYYNATVSTLNFNSVESESSVPIAFYCYTTPLLSITNVNPDDIIEQSTFKFIGDYYQLEGELLNGYKFILYDSNQSILSQSNILYVTPIEYSFNGFNNNTQYYIELIGTTVNNTEITTGLIVFTVRYVKPPLFAIAGLENQCDTGNIQISSNIVAIDGISNPEPPVYIDEQKIDLTESGSWVKWLQGFNIKDNFTMRIWGNDFTNNEIITSISNNLNGSDNLNKFELSYIQQETLTGNGIQILLKCWENSTIPYIIHSNVIETPLTSDRLFIWVRRIDNLFDLVLENLGGV